MPTLEERVTTLEGQLEELIENLRLNNKDMTDALDAIADQINDAGLRTSITALIGSTCTRVPPGC